MAAPPRQGSESDGVTPAETLAHLSELVRDLMTRDVVTVEPGDSVKEVARLLLEHDVRCLPVVDLGEMVVGVVSEADIISREGFPTGRSHRLSEFIGRSTDERRHHWSDRAAGMTAGEVMTSEVVSCRPDEPVAVVARRMLSHGVRCLPVLEEARLVGVISRHDVLRLFDVPDNRTRDRLRRVLDDPRWAPEGCHVDVRVREGLVTLEGTIRFKSDVSVLEGFVRDIPGVVGVTNRVEGLEERAEA